MLNQIKWVKPNGLEIETNDKPETIEAARALGWELHEPKKRKTRKKSVDTESVSGELL